MQFCSYCLPATTKDSGIFSNRLQMWWFKTWSEVGDKEREGWFLNGSWIMRWTVSRHYNHPCACMAVSSASSIFCHFPPPPPLLLLLEHRFISLLWEYFGMCRQVSDGAAIVDAAYWKLWWPVICSPLLSLHQNKGVSVHFHVDAGAIFYIQCYYYFPCQKKLRLFKLDSFFRTWKIMK